jgi:hypothetical protein
VRQFRTRPEILPRAGANDHKKRAARGPKEVQWVGCTGQLRQRGSITDGAVIKGSTGHHHKAQRRGGRTSSDVSGYTRCKTPGPDVDAARDPTADVVIRWMRMTASNPECGVAAPVADSPGKAGGSQSVHGPTGREYLPLVALEYVMSPFITGTDRSER